MEIRKVAFMKNEQKELLIFLLVTFGVPFLMGIPLAILSQAGTDTASFAATQMLYPAAGLMLAKLICDKDKSLMPKTFFIGFLVLTGFMILWCFAPFFLPTQTALNGTSYLQIACSIIVGISLFLESEKKCSVYGLKSKNWNLSIRLLVLFIVLYYARIFIVSVVTGNPAEALDSVSLSHLLGTLGVLPISFLCSLPFMLGEEYGWRFYFQPFLQQKFGLIKGVLLFGVLWELWHLPLVLFYYAPGASSTALLKIVLFRLIHATCLAIFMAYAYMRTHNVWLPILIHFSNNSIASIGAFDKELSWSLLGICALITMVSYLPFLFSTVFRKPKADSNIKVALLTIFNLAKKI